jgi:signal transduction histidine kinase
MRAWLDRGLLNPCTYGGIAYLLLALPLGLAEFTFLVTTISIGAGLAITLIGIPILIAAVFAWRWIAQLERRLIAALTGRVIADPYRPVAADASIWRRLGARLADPATWKDLVFLLLQLPLGAVGFIVTATGLSVGVAGLFAPLTFWAIPDGIDLGVVVVDTLPEALVLCVLGALVLRLGIPALGALARLYGAYAELLLGSNADPVLTAQVSDLRDARSRLIEAADAERRRIERDLHDGAQQRLVALALTLRMAEKRAEQGDPQAAELVRSAGEEAGLALKELRDLARGIHPAILTNRGLTAALHDLAGRAAVPVEVSEEPRERLPDPVEATVYFVVSECLANVGKHAQAHRAEIAVRVREGALEVEVSDDGVGGAELGNGSGFQGLEDRVGALEGSLAVESPSGGGTRVRATIPLVQPVEGGEARPGGPLVLSDSEAIERQARRRRLLRLRLAALGIVAAVVLSVWALTGAPNAWPVWPLLGMGLVASLDAWFVLSTPPLRRSQAADETAARALRRRRRLRSHSGAMAILNLFVLGVWIAAGAGYFWPAWVLLGSAIAVAVKALPWPDMVRERYAA